VGAGTVRTHVLGEVNVAPDSTQLAAMQELVDGAMAEGALGLTTTLIYTPETFASTEELIALARVAARHGGIYTAHMRSEGSRLLEAIRETIRIATEAGLPVHIYHLKAAGEANWAKLAPAIALIDSARAAGVAITADMYTYTAGATGLDAAMPPWVQEGGLGAWVARLGDPAVRDRVRQDMRTPSDAWESLWLAAGSPERVLLQSFRQDSLGYLIGKTIAEVAAMWEMSPEDVAMELVRRDGSRVGVAYFLMSEENVRRQLALPWVMFGSDGGSLAAEGRFLRSKPHPRAYGNFARLLGHYVRDEGILPLEEAVRRLTSLPAATFHVARRGRLAVGQFADIAVFDAATIADHATFPEPHQYATGMVHVFVNGVAVLTDGEPTGATPGRWIRRGK
jgi:N-acyl-D-amino-acid deacylase